MLGTLICPNTASGAQITLSCELGNIEKLHPANSVQGVSPHSLPTVISRCHTTYLFILGDPFFAECEVAHTRLIFLVMLMALNSMAPTAELLSLRREGH
jgi:hypothetical protein